MTIFCCTRMNDDGSLRYSYCSVDHPCPPGWMQTLVNTCDACPKVGDRDEIVAQIEQDEAGASQFADFG